MKTEQEISDFEVICWMLGAIIGQEIYKDLSPKDIEKIKEYLENENRTRD